MAARNSNTALVKQLQRLKSQQVVEYENFDVRKKVSVLFQFKEAADFDDETIFALGVNGLQGLINANKRNFEEFANDLFHIDSQSVYRSQLTQDENEAISQRIRSFLLRLCPYFMLQAAMKCMEWLIRRYSIHQFNTDDVMVCILPYHQTQQFVRVLQVLPIAHDRSRWNWLKNNRAQGVPLSSIILQQRCLSDLSILTLICRNLQDSLKYNINASSTVVVNFYTSTIVGLLDSSHSDKMNEQFMITLTPYLIKGLKSKHNESIAGTYIIITQMMMKMTFENKFCTMLIDCVTKHLSPSLQVEAIACITCICQSQNVQTLSWRAFNALTSAPEIVTSLQALSTAHNIMPLLAPMIDRLIAYCVSSHSIHDKDDDDDDDDTPDKELQRSNNITINAYVTILQQLFQDIQFQDNWIRKITNKLLKLYCHQRHILTDDDEINVLKETVALILKSINSRYPSVIDDGIKDFIDQTQSKNDSNDIDPLSGRNSILWIEEMVYLATAISKYKVIPECDDRPLIVSLYHPEAKIRSLAVRHIQQNLLTQKVDTDNKQFYYEALINRWQDDDYTVVSSVLNIGQNLTQIFDMQHLSEMLINKCNELFLDENLLSQEVLQNILTIMLDRWFLEDLKDFDTIFVAIIPHLIWLPKRKAFSSKLIQKLAKSLLVSKHPLLHDIKSLISNKTVKEALAADQGSKVAKVNNAICKWLTSNLTQDNVQNFLDNCRNQSQKFRSDTQRDVFNSFIYCVCYQWVKHWSIQQKQLNSASINCLILYLYEDLRLLASHRGHQLQVEFDTGDGIENNDDAIVTSFFNTIPIMIRKCDSKRYKKSKSMFLLRFLKALLGVLPSQNAEVDWWKWTDEYQAKIKLVDLIAYGSGILFKLKYQLYFRYLTKELLMQRNSQSRLAIQFLSHIWSLNYCKQELSNKDRSNFLNSSPILQCYSLNLATALIQGATDKILKDLMNSSCPLVPSLLVPINSENPCVRKAAVIFLKTCIDRIHAIDSSVMAFAFANISSTICQASETIVADREQISKVFASHFDKLTADVKSKEKKSSRSKAAILKRAKESAIEANFNCIMEHVTNLQTPPIIRYNVLTSLQQVNNTLKLKFGMEFFMRLLDIVRSEQIFDLRQEDALCLQNFLNCFTKDVAKNLATEPLLLNSFMTALSIPNDIPYLAHQSPQTLSLTQVTPDFFAAIKDEKIQQKIFSYLCDQLLIASAVERSSTIPLTLSKIPLTAGQYNTEFTTLNFTSIKDQTSKRPRKQIKVVNTTTSSSEDWRRLILLLESLQSKENVINAQELLPIFFGLLSKCMELDDSDIEYGKQLLLSNIIWTCKIVHKDILLEEYFDVEQVVNCIRKSDNPQTHQQALLALNLIANIFPDLLFHNVMSVFTFMGANIMKHDSAYNFQIINQTIDAIIPPLLESNTLESQMKIEINSGKGVMTSVGDVITRVIQVFVDAWAHIPSHRRVPLFEHLLRKSGSCRSLSTTLLMLVESEISNVDEDTTAQVNRDNKIDFCLPLYQKFDVVTQLDAIIDCVKYISNLSDDQRDSKPVTGRSRKSPETLQILQIFDVETHTSKQLRRYRYTVAGLIVNLMDDSKYTEAVSDLKNDKTRQLEKKFIELLEESLRYITKISKLAELHRVESIGRYWNALNNRFNVIVDKVNGLLPLHAFIPVISSLLKSDNIVTCRKSFDLLGSKLVHVDLRTILELKTQVIGLVDQLLEIVIGSKDQLYIKEKALYCISSISSYLAPEDPPLFTHVIKGCLKVLTEPSLSMPVLAAALFCLSEICRGIGAHMIAFLPQLMPQIMKIFKLIRDESQGDQPSKKLEVLVTAAVKFAHRIISCLPHFVSPYLTELLKEFTRSYISGTLIDLNAKKSSQTSELVNELDGLREDTASLLPHILLPAIGQSYKEIMLEDDWLEVDTNRIAMLMSVVKISISKMPSVDIKSMQPKLINIFMEAFDYRITTQAKICSVSLDVSENAIIEAFLALVVRLSEKTFWPAFRKVFDWATVGDVPKERNIVFFRATNRIADTLKGLFLIFASDLVTYSAKLLDANNASKGGKFFSNNESDASIAEEKSSLLTELILDCLYKCFLYDRQKFFDQEKFDLLMQPLVDQIDNQIDGAANYEERVLQHLLPCIVEFAVVIENDALWKPLHYQICLKTRHKSPQVRFASVKIIGELYRRLGENFILLLPETIPFLAELMEDESVEVEKECQEVVAVIENITGESVEKFF
ncbi:HEAT repeat-containing protein 1 [Trichoplax sp. H2]|nr:HEAT repeat-containing protein 1 [Trichoplax sp. H2]|eukprot:RDD43642.1 HEAT repeat-containing protein 1 [Trichoplax sp. H2]